MPEPTFDADGYPTDETLEVVTKWPIVELADTGHLLEYVQRAWNFPEYFTKASRRHREWKTGPLQRRWTVHTVGWSGNESLIGAMESNWLFWALTWEESRRGGHFKFLVTE